MHSVSHCACKSVLLWHRGKDISSWIKMYWVKWEWQLSYELWRACHATDIKMDYWHFHCGSWCKGCLSEVGHRVIKVHVYNLKHIIWHSHPPETNILWSTCESSYVWACVAVNTDDNIKYCTCCGTVFSCMFAIECNRNYFCICKTFISLVIMLPFVGDFFFFLNHFSTL